MNRDGDQFDRAEIDDHLLDLADDHQLRADVWDTQHGVDRDHPTFDEWAAYMATVRKAASIDVGHERWFAREW